MKRSALKISPHIFANQLGKPQNLNDLSSSIDKVEQLYREKGFLLARVVDVKDDPDGNISLKVNEGQIESVQIAGNRKDQGFYYPQCSESKAGHGLQRKAVDCRPEKIVCQWIFPGYTPAVCSLQRPVLMKYSAEGRG